MIARLFLFVSILLLPFGAQAQNATGIIAALAPPGSIWDTHWDLFKERIAEDPSIEFEMLIRGEVGNEENMLSAVRRNRVQITGGTMWSLSSVVPELSVILAPYVFDSVEEADYIYDVHLTPILTELFAEKNLVLLSWSETGANALYANRPVLVPTDSVGVKLRGSPNIAAQAFLRAVGADAVALGTAELAPALQTGVADGGLSAIMFFYTALRDFATDLTLTSQTYDKGLNLANGRWWSRLTDSQRDNIRAAFVEPERERAAIRKIDAENLERLPSMGVNVHRLSTEQKALWKEASAEVPLQIVEEIGGRSQELYDIIQEGKRSYAEQTGG